MTKRKNAFNESESNVNAEKLNIILKNYKELLFCKLYKNGISLHFIKLDITYLYLIDHFKFLKKKIHES